MRIPDYHIHTHYSPDSSMQPLHAIEYAIKVGVTDMCFTEHMDLGHHMESFNRIPAFQEMHDSVQMLRNRYLDINIGYGLEVGYMAETAAQTANVISQQAFDYILLSTHCVDGVDCYLPESKRGRDKVTAYRRYLETLYESIIDCNLCNYYDCVGHIGYIAKCNHYEENSLPYECFPELLDEILLRIIKNEKGIEVNTSGLKKAGHLLPHPSIISRYYELGGRIITVGSDAHRPEQVGGNIREAMKIIKDSGFKEITLFCNRVPQFISI